MLIGGQQANGGEFNHSEVTRAGAKLHGFSVLVHTEGGMEVQCVEVRVFCSRRRVVDVGSLPCSRKGRFASISQVGEGRQCSRQPEQRRIGDESEPLREPSQFGGGGGESQPGKDDEIVLNGDGWRHQTLSYLARGSAEWTGHQVQVIGQEAVGVQDLDPRRARRRPLESLARCR